MQWAPYRPTVEEGTDKTWLGGQVTERSLAQRYPPPTSPLESPLYVVLIGMPLLVWLAIGGYLLTRRRRLRRSYRMGRVR
jgi:hypothetical protein